jgi:hypothetical protein
MRVWRHRQIDLKSRGYGPVKRAALLDRVNLSEAIVTLHQNKTHAGDADTSLLNSTMTQLGPIFAAFLFMLAFSQLDLLTCYAAATPDSRLGPNIRLGDDPPRCRPIGGRKPNHTSSAARRIQICSSPLFRKGV